MATKLTGIEHNIYRSDGKVHLYRVGGGDPILFIHGVGGNGSTWGKVIDHLSPHFACYVVDMPGFGESDMPGRQYSMEDFADSMLDVLDAAGLEQTTIVGDHTGAILGVILATKHPKRVKNLVFDGLPFWNVDRGRVIWEKFFLPQFTDTTSYSLPVDPLTVWEEEKEKNPTLEKADFELRAKEHKRSRLWGRLSHETATQFDVESASAGISQPTLLIYGEHDALRRGEQRANEGINGSILKVIPGSKGAHATAHSGNPEGFAKEIKAFLQ
jgi:pimeloyl-ACP methyl ester carboxylesterase